MITFKTIMFPQTSARFVVLLDGKHVGNIHSTSFDGGGFKYIPKGKVRTPAFHGPVFKTVDEVMDDVRGDGS